MLPCYAECKGCKIVHKYGRDGLGAMPFEAMPAPFSEKIDATASIAGDMANKGIGRVDYFFSGDQVLTYTLWMFEKQSKRVKKEPMKISQHPLFNQLPPPFNQKIDAVSWNGGLGRDRIDLIFSGDQVIEYTLWSYASQRCKSQPMKISEHHLFKDLLPAPFNQRIDAISQDSNFSGARLSWLFHDDMVIEYVLYHTIGVKHGPRGAPMKIKDSPIFNELPETFTQKIDAFSFNGTAGQMRQDTIYTGDQVMGYKLYQYALKKTAAQNGKRLQWEPLKRGFPSNSSTAKVAPESMARD